MADKCEFRFNPHLLNHIKFFRNDDVKLMVNDELVEKSDGFGTLLHRAAYYDNVEIVEHLLKLGSDVNFLGAAGTTPLMVAVQNERLATVKVLLNVGANIDIVDAKGQSALQMVFHSDYSESQITQEFINKIENVTFSTVDLAKKLLKSGCAPYHATVLHDISVMQYLLVNDLEVSNNNSRPSVELPATGRIIPQVVLQLCIKLENNYFEHQNPNASSTYDIFYYSLFLRTKLFYTWMKGISDKSFHRASSDVYNLIAHFVMLEKSMNVCIIKDIRLTSIVISPEKKAQIVHSNYYEHCQQILSTTMLEKSTLFDLLTNQHKMRTRVRNEKFVSAIKEVCSLHKLNELYPFYVKALMMHISKANKIVEQEDKAIIVISKIFNSNYNESYNFAREVVSYLNKQELERLCYIYD